MEAYGPDPFGSPTFEAHQPRDAAGDAPRPWWHRPKTPAGRRGVSLFHSRTTATGQTPRRSRLVLSERAEFFETSEARGAVGRICSSCRSLPAPFAKARRG